MDRLPRSRRKKRVFVLAAFAVATTACVSVPDDIKATFATPAPGEIDNYAVRSPHGHAPKDDPITKPLVAGLDASAPIEDSGMPAVEGMCARDATTTSSLDAAAPVSSNCTDAGLTGAGAK